MGFRVQWPLKIPVIQLKIVQNAQTTKAVYGVEKYAIRAVKTFRAPAKRRVPRAVQLLHVMQQNHAMIAPHSLDVIGVVIQRAMLMAAIMVV